MAQLDQKVFFIELMQPRSLLCLRDKLAYSIAVRLAAGIPITLMGGLICGSFVAMIAGPHVGLIGGLAGGLAGGLVGGLAGGLFLGLAGILAVILTVALTAGITNLLISGIIIGATVGVAIGLLTGIALELRVIPRDELFLRLMGGAVSGMSIVIPLTLILWNAEVLGLELFVGLVAGLFAGITIGLGGGVVTRLTAGLAKWSMSSGVARVSATSSGIDLVELVTWSPQQALTGLAISTPVLLLAVLLAGVPTSLVVGVSVALIAGMRSRQQKIEMNPFPNQGVWRSGRNAIQVGIASGLVVGLAVGLFSHPVYGLLDGLAIAIAGAINFGGFAFIQHFTLRYILYRTKRQPWHYSRFLDYCVKLTFMQKVGGGYIFTHELLSDHFASMYRQNAPEFVAPSGNDS